MAFMKKTAIKRLATILVMLTLVVGILPFQASAGIYGTNYSGFTTKVGNVSLPLPEYPNGSACTNNGSPCSGPGHFGSNCKRYYTYNGKTVDVLGWQCCGFARYVFWRCFGVVPTDGTGSGYYKAVSNVGGGSMTVSYLKSIFGSKVKAGAHIRTGLGQDGFNHSLIYAGCDDSYVYTYEGNFDGYCRVSMVRRTWSEMASYLQYKNGIYYIDMPNNYPSSAPAETFVNINDGTYVISPHSNAGYAIDISGQSMDNGAQSHIWTKHYGDSQKFVIQQDGDKTYTLRNLKTGKYLEILYGGANGEYKVTQCHYTGADCQRWYMIANSDGSYTLKNKGTGKYMDLANGTIADGTDVQTWTANGTSAQKWWLNPTDTLIDGVYTVRSSANTGWGWDISGYSMDGGANLQVWDSQHKFVFQHDDSGYYTIRVLGSGHYIDVPYGKKDNSVSLWQCTYNGGDAQKWLIIPNTDGTYSFVSKCNGKYIDMQGGGTPANGTDVIQYTGNGTSAQKWVMNLQSEAPEGTFYISYAANPNYRLEIQNRSVDNGGNLILYQAHGATSQQFTLAKQGNGYYTITNVNSGKQLDVAGGGRPNGTNIQQWAGNGVNQNWSVIPNTDGSYSFVSRANNRYLDLANNTVAKDTNIQCCVNNGSTAQRWDLHKTDSVANGAYCIEYAGNTGFRMDVSGQSLEDGAAVHLWTAHGGTSQKFFFFSTGGGYYKVINANSGKLLDARDAKAANGTVLQQCGDNGTNAQRWLVLRNVDNSYTFVSALGGYALDLSNGTAENGRHIGLWAAHNGINQKWRLTATNAELLNGWHTTDGYKSFYVNSQKILGWLASGGNVYRTDDNGAMQTGWQKVDGSYRYFNADGTMRTGWLTENGKSYYLCNDGAMAIGWATIDSKLYYFDANGARVTGTQTINGQTFTFDANGVLQN